MKKLSGFSAIIVFVLIVILAVVGFATIRVASNKSSNKNESKTNVSTDKTSSEQEATKTSKESKTTSADCTIEPVLPLPVELSRIKSILYPGQVRGGNFKPHGGFILNGSNEADITLPMDAKVIDGVRYTEGGEVQYLFDFEAACGYRFRLDHLHTLSADMQALAETLPQPTTDSRTTNIESKQFEAGTVVATHIGFLNTKNTSFDFGFYDMNKQNEASKASDWPTDFQYTTELATHGTCWFDYLSAENEAAVKALPAGDGSQGKNSLFCR